MSKRLEGKVAVISGGSSGIGLAAAQRFAEEGARVFIIGRRQRELETAVARVGANAVGIQADVSRLPDLDRAYALIGAATHRIDVLLANAGGGQLAPLGSITEAHFHGIFDTNVKGTLFTVQKALPLLRDGSSIILMSSSTAATGTPAYSVYSASKAAVRNFARSWMLDLQSRRIRVNVISPGPTRTPGLSAMAAPGHAERMMAGFAGRIPLGRVGDATEVANAAVFLACDESSYVNGIELAVDGGFAQF